MKKQFLSILLCVCMMLTLLPTTVLACEPSVSIGGVTVTGDEWYAVTDESGMVTECVNTDDWNIHVAMDAVESTTSAAITLKNATISNSLDTHAIKVEGYDLNILLDGTSNQIGVGITSEYGDAIYSSTSNNVTITGQGDLTLKGNCGIRVNGLGKVNINTTGNLSIASEWQMVQTSGNITVAAKSIEATGYYFYGYTVSLTATDGDIHSTGSGQYVIQADGDVTVSAPKGAISISGTQYAIKAMDYSVNVAAKNDVTLTGTVNGKEISITSEAGNLTINGYYKAIESAQTSVTLSAPSGDMLLNAKNNSNIISGSNNFTLAITAGGTLTAEGPYGIVGYGDATIKADKVFVANTADGYGFNGGVLTITSPGGGNCSELYISGGKGNRDAINAYRDVSIKADKVTIIAAFNAEHAINASSIMGDVTVTIGDTGLIVGAINVIGTNAISTGMLHAEKNGNNASYGLNLNTNTPSQSTYYKAGDGYAIFVPAAGEAPATLLLNNATINNQTTLTNNAIGMENEGIALPTGNIIIKAEGTNSITSSYGDGIGYLGSHVTLAGSGVLTVEGSAGDISLDDGSFSFADGSDVTLNAVVSVTNDNIPQNTNTVYGNMTVDTYFRSLYRDAIIANGATVTIPRGEILWMDETTSININGQIVNNGKIVLPYNYTIEQIQALNLTGNIQMRNAAENKYRIYVDGSIYAYGGNVDYNFSINSAPTEVTYYKTINGYFIFTPASDDSQARLTFHNVDIYGDFTLPDVPLTFNLEGVNTIESIAASSSIVIEGSGKLDVYDFENSNASAALTVNSGATLNTKYTTTEDGIRTNTIYGSYMLSEDSRFYAGPTQNLVLSSGAVFTFRYSGNLEFHSGATLDDMTLGAGASIVNNTHITLPQGTTPAQIAALPLSGSGVVRVTTAYDNHGYPEAWDTYTNEGLPITVVDGDDLTLTDTEVLESDNKGYTWNKTGEGNDEVWTLTLNNTFIDGSLYLPNKAIVINSTNDSIINGNIGTDSGYVLNINFTGTAPLTIGGWISGGINGDSLTVQGGAKVTVDGVVFLGGNGGVNGTLNVTGTGTLLNVSSSMGYAVMCDSVNVQNGATMTVSAQGEDSIGVEALTGVSVTGGSMLTANCDYGVYIIDGKLEVDDDSTLVTNASVAPFCVVDRTSLKFQSDVVSLPGLPEETEIASVTGTDDGYGYAYWSLVPADGSLGATDENSVVTLSGAVKGPVTFAKPSGSGDNGSGTSAGGTTGTGKMPAVSITGGNGSVKAEVSVKDSTATISVTDKQIEEIISGKIETGTVKLDLSKLDVKAVTIPTKVITAADKSGTSTGIEVKLPTGSLTLDKMALDAVSSKNGDVTISLEKVDSTKLTDTQRDTLGNQAGTAVIVDVNVLAGGKKLSAFGGGKVGISVPYTAKSGEDTSKLTIWFIRDDGTIEPKNGKYNAVTGCVDFITEHLSRYMIVSFPFGDVAENAWYYGSVAYASNNGLFSGTDEATFSPDSAMTREMIWMVLARMDGKTPGNMDEARAWAMTSGISDGSDPSGFITREQMAALLYRYASYKKYDTTQGGMAIREYADYDSISGYAMAAMGWSVNTGLVQGSGSKLMPQGTATRAQVATILQRFCRNAADK